MHVLEGHYTRGTVTFRRSPARRPAPVPTEIWIHALQHEPVDADGLHMRRLTAGEVHQRVLERRAGWLAWELGSTELETQIAAAINADPELTTALEPREFDERRIGIVLDENLRTRLRAAIGQ